MRRLVAVTFLTMALAAPPRGAAALSIQEAILRAKPAVVVIRAEVQADVSMNCGGGPTMVQPPPYIEIGTGWFVNGQGWVITNAHVVDPAHRMPVWVTHELKKKAIDQACVEPALKARGLMSGDRPDIEDRIRREAAARALDSAKITAVPKITVVLANGVSLP